MEGASNGKYPVAAPFRFYASLTGPGLFAIEIVSRNHVDDRSGRNLGDQFRRNHSGAALRESIPPPLRALLGRKCRRLAHRSLPQVGQGVERDQKAMDVGRRGHLHSRVPLPVRRPGPRRGIACIALVEPLRRLHPHRGLLRAEGETQHLGPGRGSHRGPGSSPRLLAKPGLGRDGPWRPSSSRLCLGVHSFHRHEQETRHILAFQLLRPNGRDDRRICPFGVCGGSVLCDDFHPGGGARGASLARSPVHRHSLGHVHQGALLYRSRSVCSPSPHRDHRGSRPFFYPSGRGPGNNSVGRRGRDRALDTSLFRQDTRPRS